MRGLSHGCGRRDIHLLHPITSGAICSYLALWLALFPVFQAAHLTFADHAHCFCHEHLRIEDVPRAEPSESRAGDRLGHDSHLRSLRAARPRTNPPDTLLNFGLDREPTLPDSRPAATQLGDMVATSLPAQVGASAPQPILLLAPKTSPPSLASV
jgi:hypothetical protein